MKYFFALILFPIIIALGGVHGRRVVQHPILTPLTQNGQEYNCIDFYKQPAFDHPLLRHLVPKEINSTVSVQVKFNDVDGGCPDGTVPIPRILLEEPLPPPPPRARVHCYAIVRTNTNKKFYGSNAQSSLYKPEAEGSQWSSARIKLSNGGDSIEAGWMVYPEYFKDNELHLYARFNAGPTECLNLHCPGFVQVAKETPLGSTTQSYSSVAGPQFMWRFSIDKHKDDGNWWLSMSFDSVTTYQIGYWPGSLFTKLKDSATQVEWGGEINDPGAAEPAPVMGSGVKAEYDQSLSAYFQQITVVDESFNKVIPDGTDKFYDCPDLYTVLDWGDMGGDNGRVISYGGSQPRG